MDQLGPDPARRAAEGIWTSIYGFPASTRAVLDLHGCVQVAQLDVVNPKIELPVALGGPRGGPVSDHK